VAARIVRNCLPITLVGCIVVAQLYAMHVCDNQTLAKHWSYCGLLAVSADSRLATPEAYW